MSRKKYFADTNLFLRYLTNDVPAQAEQVEAILHLAKQGQLTLVLNSWVIAEIIWTLESFYGMRKDEIQECIFAICNTPGLQIENEGRILQAVLWYVEKNVDFIDALNAAWMIETGIERVVTFDQKHFNRFEGIVAESPADLLT